MLPALPVDDDLVAAVLRPEYPLVVVVHDEAGSQVRNPFEQALIEPILRTLADPARYGLDAEEGLGVVVPAPGRSGRRCSRRSPSCASSTRPAGCRRGRPSTRWSGSRAGSGR